MTVEQILLFSLFATILGLLLWGRYRYDLVAAGGLLTAVALGLVPDSQAFSGFSNPAVLVVALVLIASRAFENSGALALLTDRLANERRGIGAHIAIVGSMAAGLSAVINNVAALAILMPFDIQAARKAGRPPGLTLMPLAFATILGGMVTLIGTPPNIVASAVRAERLGQPYQLFDFTPVGLAVALAGVAFVALIGWRLVPRREDKAQALIGAASFKAELAVPEDSPAIGRAVAELDEEAEKADVLMIGLARDGSWHYARARALMIEQGDVLIVEGSAEALAAFIKAVGLHAAEEPRKLKDEAGEEEAKHTPAIIEAVVRADSRVAGRSAAQLALRPRFGITLLGLTHAGYATQQNLRSRTIEAGDVLLLAGRGAATPATLDLLGLLPINRVNVAPRRPWQIALAVGLFVGAIVAAATGTVSFTVAIAMAVAGYGLFGLVPAREFYQQVEWPVVVMLACLLPIGAAFDRVGGTALIAQGIVDLTQAYPPVVALVALMVVTMTLSDALNNVATMIVAGPIAIDLAQRLGANPDTFLMGVAVAASCAFLTPIGHKNNTLIMGPGGFRFADYWRMGLPLELVVLAVALPALLLFWPL